MPTCLIILIACFVVTDGIVQFLKFALRPRVCMTLCGFRRYFVVDQEWLIMDRVIWADLIYII